MRAHIRCVQQAKHSELIYVDSSRETHPPFQFVDGKRVEIKVAVPPSQMAALSLRDRITAAGQSAGKELQSTAPISGTRRQQAHIANTTHTRTQEIKRNELPRQTSTQKRQGVQQTGVSQQETPLLSQSKIMDWMVISDAVPGPHFDETSACAASEKRCSDTEIRSNSASGTSRIQVAAMHHAKDNHSVTQHNSVVVSEYEYQYNLQWQQRRVQQQDYWRQQQHLMHVQQQQVYLQHQHQMILQQQEDQYQQQIRMGRMPGHVFEAPSASHCHTPFSTSLHQPAPANLPHRWHELPLHIEQQRQVPNANPYDISHAHSSAPSAQHTASMASHVRNEPTSLLKPTHPNELQRQMQALFAATGCDKEQQDKLWSLISAGESGPSRSVQSQPWPTSITSENHPDVGRVRSALYSAVGLGTESYVPTESTCPQYIGMSKATTTPTATEGSQWQRTSEYPWGRSGLFIIPTPVAPTGTRSADGNVSSFSASDHTIACSGEDVFSPSQHEISQLEKVLQSDSTPKHAHGTTK